MSQYCLVVEKSECDLAPVSSEIELGEERKSVDPAFLPSSAAGDEYDRVFNRMFAKEHQGEFADPPEHDYAILERHLPSQDVIASSGDVMCLYCATFFLPLKIFGCMLGMRMDHWRSKSTDEIGSVPANACSFIGTRGIYPKLEYGLTW